MGKPRLVIIGPGRMGQGLGLALKRRGYSVSLVARTPRELLSGLTLHIGPWPDVVSGAEVVLIATPDDAIEAVARRLADDNAVTHEQVVLHLAGALDRSALAPLNATGAGLGSFHPLQSVADPATAGDRLRGAFAGVEGDDRAIVAAERLAQTLRMTPVRIPGDAKAAYHAAATFAGNYLAALVGIAERIAREGGVPEEMAERMYLPLLTGAASNIGQLGVRGSLTGPVRRADVRTIAAHLGALSAADQSLYRALALETVRLSREAGMEETPAKLVEAYLTDSP
jgi:predicted short-subunit dehydrogenase-like oxidoreductase (DUF2520 family)